VTIYEAMPKMGGMLQYGVPEYRLPKKILQKEISAIEKMGVIFKNNSKIGRDVTLEYLRENYHAVIAAVGAWKSMRLGCQGENLDGVLPAIDFLRNIEDIEKIENIEEYKSKSSLTGHRVAVVGGGNVAMDACRTAVRLGADKVYNIYRRTKNEMPANQIEITEAEEEGVIFKNLTDPIEIIGENNKVKAVRLQIMELGEPDKSGRRSPIPATGDGK
jgi:formate dehydrogenase major subunit